MRVKKSRYSLKKLPVVGSPYTPCHTKLRKLIYCDAHVKGENFAISVWNDSRILKAVFWPYFVHSVKSFFKTFASVWVIQETVASVGRDNQFVFHDKILAVRDQICNNFFRFFDRFFVKIIKLAPVWLVIHEFINAPFGIAKGDLQNNNVVNVNFSFNFHVYRLQGGMVAVNGFFKF